MCTHARYTKAIIATDMTSVHDMLTFIEAEDLGELGMGAADAAAFLRLKARYDAELKEIEDAEEDDEDDDREDEDEDLRAALAASALAFASGTAEEEAARAAEEAEEEAVAGAAMAASGAEAAAREKERRLLDERRTACVGEGTP